MAASITDAFTLIEPSVRVKVVPHLAPAPAVSDQLHPVKSADRPACHRRPVASVTGWRMSSSLRTGVASPALRTALNLTLRTGRLPYALLSGRITHQGETLESVGNGRPYSSVS